MTCSNTAPIQHARSLLEEELRKRGIRVVSLDTGVEQREHDVSFQPPQREMGHGCEGEIMMDTEVDKINEEYTITEEVLNDLLRDIEEQIIYDGKVSLRAQLSCERRVVILNPRLIN
jgi:hypothetical protein